jgi:hypothetical protein
VISLISNALSLIGSIFAFFNERRWIAAGVQQEKNHELQSTDQNLRKAESIRDRVQHEDFDSALDEL